MQKLKMQNKKGQLSGMAVSILAVGVAIIVLVLSLVIVQEMRDIDIVTDALAVTTTNETLSPNVTEVGARVSEGTSPAFAGFSITEIVSKNATGNFWVTLGSGNYTTNTTGTIFFASDAASDAANFNNTEWRATYTHTEGGEAYISTNTSLVGLGTFGDFISIIVLAVVAGIVLGIIFGVFGGFRRRTR